MTCLLSSRVLRGASGRMGPRSVLTALSALAVAAALAPRFDVFSEAACGRWAGARTRWKPGAPSAGDPDPCVTVDGLGRPFSLTVPAAPTSRVVEEVMRACGGAVQYILIAPCQRRIICTTTNTPG